MWYKTRQLWSTVSAHAPRTPRRWAATAWSRTSLLSVLSHKRSLYLSQTLSLPLILMCACSFSLILPPPFSFSHPVRVNAGQVGVLRRNVKRLRGGLVCKAHRRVYHSTRGSRGMMKRKKKLGLGLPLWVVRVGGDDCGYLVSSQLLLSECTMLK